MHIIDAYYRRIFYNEKVAFETSGDVPPTKMNHFSITNPIFKVAKAPRPKNTYLHKKCHSQVIFDYFY